MNYEKLMVILILSPLDLAASIWRSCSLDKVNLISFMPALLRCFNALFNSAWHLACSKSDFYKEYIAAVKAESTIPLLYHDRRING